MSDRQHVDGGFAVGAGVLTALVGAGLVASCWWGDPTAVQPNGRPPLRTWQRALAGSLAVVVGVRMFVIGKRIEQRELEDCDTAISGDCAEVKLPEDDGSPFMEHPTGEYQTAVDAMAVAINRLRQLPKWDRWITFCAQGDGGFDDDMCSRLKLRNDAIDAGALTIDTDKALRDAGLASRGLQVSTSSEGHVVLHDFTPRQVASFLDAVFRGQMGTRPYEGEDDYPVGAEWSGPSDG